MEGKYPIIIDGKSTGELIIEKTGLHMEFTAQCSDVGGILRLSVYGETEGYLGVMVPEGGYLRLRKKLSRNSMAGFPQKITHGGMAGQKRIPEETGMGRAAENAGHQPRPDDGNDVCPVPPRPEHPVLPSEPENGETTPLPPIPENGEVAPEPPMPENGEVAPELPVPENGGAECPVPPPPTDCIPEPECREPPQIEPFTMQYDETNPEDLAMPVPEYIREPNPEPTGNAPPESDDIDTVWYPEPTPWSLFSSAALKSSFSCVRGALAAVENGESLIAVPNEGSDVVLGSYKVGETRLIEGTEYAIFRVKNGKLI